MHLAARLACSICIDQLSWSHSDEQQVSVFGASQQLSCAGIYCPKHINWKPQTPGFQHSATNIHLGSLHSSAQGSMQRLHQFGHWKRLPRMHDSTQACACICSSRSVTPSRTPRWASGCVLCSCLPRLGLMTAAGQVAACSAHCCVKGADGQGLEPVQVGQLHASGQQGTMLPMHFCRAEPSPISLAIWQHINLHHLEHQTVGVLKKIQQTKMPSVTKRPCIYDKLRCPPQKNVVVHQPCWLRRHT